MRPCFSWRGALDQPGEVIGRLVRKSLLLEELLLGDVELLLLELLFERAGLQLRRSAGQERILRLVAQPRLLGRGVLGEPRVAFESLELKVLLLSQEPGGRREALALQAGKRRRLGELLLLRHLALKHRFSIAAEGSGRCRRGVRLVELLGVLLVEQILRRLRHLLRIGVLELRQVRRTPGHHLRERIVGPRREILLRRIDIGECCALRLIDLGERRLLRRIEAGNGGPLILLQR